MTARRLALVAPILLLSACGGGQQADPGGLSASEAQELNDAAAMLDANAIDLDEVTGNEVTP